MPKFEKLKKDFRGVLFSKLRKYRLLMLRHSSTFITKVVLKLKGINIGKSCQFYGIPTVNRSPLSTINIGKNCAFRSDKTSNLIGLNRKCIISTFGSDSKIEIGNNSRFSGTVIGAKESIIIGNDVLCGANVLITDFDWHPIDPERRHTSNGVKSAPVVIEDNVWLGINSVVLKGVRIGENSVIGANSIVIKDIPANVIAAGNPCKVIKSL